MANIGLQFTTCVRGALYRRDLLSLTELCYAMRDMTALVQLPEVFKEGACWTESAISVKDVVPPHTRRSLRGQVGSLHVTSALLA